MSETTAPETAPEPEAAKLKEGYKSTEFWILVGVQLAGLLFDAGVFDIAGVEWLGPVIGGVLHLAGLLGYGPARAKVKAEFEKRQATVETKRAEVRVATLEAVKTLDEAQRAELLAKLLDPADPTGTAGLAIAA